MSAERSSTSLLDQALDHHRARRFREAETLYRQLIAREPGNADALHLLGVLAYQAGQREAAINLIRQSIAINPEHADAYSNLGNILHEIGNFPDAIAACRRAIELRPNFAAAFGNLGNALRSNGEIQAAIDAHRRAIEIRPTYAPAYTNLGNALRLLRSGDAELLDQAIAAHQRAIHLQPNFAEAHNNLGNALREKRLFTQAIASLERAIQLQPKFFDAHVNLANALTDDRQFSQAIDAYRRGLELNPNHAESHLNLGNAFDKIGLLDHAAAEFRKAIELKPDLIGAHANLGTIFKEQGDLDAANIAYRQAMAIDPASVAVHSNIILCLNYQPGIEYAEVAAELARWNDQHARSLKYVALPHENDPDPNRRLRIGYLSPDFNDHPIGRFLLPLLAHHDASAFEIFAYGHVSVPDSTTQALRTYIHHWRNLIGLTDAEAADLIRSDGIDILVDLALHAGNNRLLILARKPAPVQVTYLAYAGSSGLDAIDYRLTDPYLDPPGIDESIYSEKTFRLPTTYWCYQPATNLPVSPSPAVANGFITFGCLNNFCKVNTPLLKLWAQLMTRTPRSHLILHAREGSHRQRLLDRMQQIGIEPDRIRFVAKVPLTDYFRCYDSIDIALDTTPFGGGTTSCDALWMGVPVISVVGNRAVGRAGLSILSNVGLSELVAQDSEPYVQIAVDLAGDIARLQALRSTMRDRLQASPLGDARRFARDVEAAYRQMWRAWCAQPAGSGDVAKMHHPE